jgi:hypothetical protein
MNIIDIIIILNFDKTKNLYLNLSYHFIYTFIKFLNTCVYMEQIIKKLENSLFYIFKIFSYRDVIFF